MKMQLFLYVILLGLVVNLLANIIWKYIPKTNIYIDKIVTVILIVICIFLLVFYQDDRDPKLDDNERKVKVRVHQAKFLSSPTLYYFINVTNLSTNRSIEVTHLAYKDESHYIPIEQASRKLPVRLLPDQSWESFINVKKIPASSHSNSYRNFYARISSGKVFSSEKNITVPPHGSVPDGTIRFQ